MTSASRTVLDIPELAQIVCSHNTVRDSAHLARTSRRLFNAITPLLWERVKGAYQLFALLPRVKVKEMKGYRYKYRHFVRKPDW
jgi:hypothetical protein